MSYRLLDHFTLVHILFMFVHQMLTTQFAAYARYRDKQNLGKGDEPQLYNVDEPKNVGITFKSHSSTTAKEYYKSV